MRKHTLIRTQYNDDVVIVQGNFDENNSKEAQAYFKVSRKRKMRNKMAKNSKRINRGK